MYSVKPKKQNKLTAFTVIGCFVCGIGLFCLSIGQDQLPYATLTMQLISVLLLIAGICLYSRFFAHQFTYSVRPGDVFDQSGDELYHLVVIDTVGGSKQRVVCRLWMRDIVQIDARPARSTPKNGYPKIEATQEGGKVFYYCADMVPEKVIAVYDCEGNVAVLTYDEQLYRILCQK